MPQRRILALIDEHLAALQQLRSAVAAPRAGFTPIEADRYCLAVRGLEQWRSHLEAKTAPARMLEPQDKDPDE
jgi:hypothetical protein